MIRVFANRVFREIFSVKKPKSPGAHGNRQEGFKETSDNAAHKHTHLLGFSHFGLDEGEQSCEVTAIKVYLYLLNLAP